MRVFHLRPIPELLEHPQHPAWGTSTHKGGCHVYLDDEGDEAKARMRAKAEYDKPAEWSRPLAPVPASPWLNPELIKCNMIGYLHDRDKPQFKPGSVIPDHSAPRTDAR